MSDGFRWNEWNVEHIGEHGVSPIEAEQLVDDAAPPYPESIGEEKWRVCGQTAGGRDLQVIYVFDPEDWIYVIHARGLNDREKRRLRRRVR